ncbi:MAG: pyridoxamine 5'-phosphate oxidase family protein [Firmicutes bacterium]|nr:pyridoxamine 5'-phosphate oxidase family protein [Bacillota bacterium]MBQ6013290.1 pyridoxamine 5'-phosphate oxidase family protein [Bacillota bacterium]MBQ6260925.1 pyridoxamine 5'-phosphate oxidase family protein [Bacillota bacterium]MBR0114601.1 pyridoxamine 5'-phosphate oxidase family protein [Bacillota bacterium]
MFREIVRFKQAMTKEECIELLKDQTRGVLSVLGDDDYPYGMPMNHFYNEEDGKIYFHSGNAGYKVDAIKKHDKVSFCVFDKGVMNEGEWFYRVNSVIVFGRVEIIEDREKMYDIARKLSYKFTKDDAYIDYELEHSGPRTLMFAIVPEHITGKRVTEK